MESANSFYLFVLTHNLIRKMGPFFKDHALADRDRSFDFAKYDGESLALIDEISAKRRLLLFPLYYDAQPGGNADDRKVLAAVRYEMQMEIGLVHASIMLPLSNTRRIVIITSAQAPDSFVGTTLLVKLYGIGSSALQFRPGNRLRAKWPDREAEVMRSLIVRRQSDTVSRIASRFHGRQRDPELSKSLGRRRRGPNVALSTIEDDC